MRAVGVLWGDLLPGNRALGRGQLVCGQLVSSWVTYCPETGRAADWFRLGGSWAPGLLGSGSVRAVDHPALVERVRVGDPGARTVLEETLAAAGDDREAVGDVLDSIARLAAAGDANGLDALIWAVDDRALAHKAIARWCSTRPTLTTSPRTP